MNNTIKQEVRERAQARFEETADVYSEANLVALMRAFDVYEREIDHVREATIQEAFEVLERLHGTRENTYIDKDCGYCGGYAPCEVEIGIQQARTALLALLQPPTKEESAIEEGVYYPESKALDCCEKCGDVHFEKTYPAHTAYYACTNLACPCHLQADNETGVKEPRPIEDGG